MKVAIHNSKSGFHPRWIDYCQKQNIPFKLVDCYDSNIVQQLKDCNALFWHFSQSDSKDIVIAKSILFALEHVGFKVFPDFKTAWHFDDKLGQKYLLEALNLPAVPAYAFFEKQKALEWIEKTSFPKVWKLRGGAGSANVKLVNNKLEARKIVKKSFGSGFKQYEAWTNLKDRIYKYREGRGDFINILKGVARFGYEPDFSKTIGAERAYVYFQDFVPQNDSDTRIIVIDKKAFALKRMVRKGDFRASGSGEFFYSKEHFDEQCVKLAFYAAKRLQSQCVAFDFIFDESNNPLLVEISYGFTPSGYDDCPGFWDETLIWHEEKFNPQGWMVESVLKSLNE